MGLAAVRSLLVTMVVEMGRFSNFAHHLSTAAREVDNRSFRRGSVVLKFAILLWALGIAVGWLMLEGYANRPCELAMPPVQWPVDSQLAVPYQLAERDRLPRLLLFAHPRCPCTRATLAELERFMARNMGKVSATIVFTKPPGAPDGWEESDILRRAQGIAGATTVVDTGGVESRRFQARTSGFAMLYEGGRLAFYGGLTASRGHEGDSVGLAAIQAILVRSQRSAGAAPSVEHCDVFGCPLQTRDGHAAICGKDGACPLRP
jgi:hypothetical protein